MKVRAVIFDIYKTVLKVGPPPGDAEERWRNLCAGTFGNPTEFSLNEFAVACEKIIAREHAAARAIGIACPEIYWPAVTREALPDLAQLSAAACDDFLFQHAQLQRTIGLMEDAAEVLTQLSQSELLLGIASNSQPYTLRELDGALSAGNLNRNIFKPELSFFSFENGFSKPDPHVFRFLTARLQNRRVSSGEILMVGDRLDNDIEPARANGWQTWHLNTAVAENAGNWKALRKRLSV